MAKKIIWVNESPAEQVVTETPYNTALTGGFQYSDDPLNIQYVEPVLTRLRAAYPTKLFKAGNPGSPPPTWP